LRKQNPNVSCGIQNFIIFHGHSCPGEGTLAANDTSILMNAGFWWGRRLAGIFSYLYAAQKTPAGRRRYNASQVKFVAACDSQIL
jgi:hypothetical protein